MKVLFISNVLSHITTFHLPYVKWFHENGHSVHVMTNAAGQEAPFCEKLYDLPIERSPFNVKNIPVLRQAEEIIENENYDIIHCHTPMGGVIGRLASRKAIKKGCIVIYTAHGFHFYDGAPAINWLLYYNMEKYLSNYTDCIITINEEDYKRAKRRFAHPGLDICKIDGIGVDIKRFSKPTQEEKLAQKRKLGYEDKFVLVYAAEFIPRKNHIFLIEAMQNLSVVCPEVKLVFAGKGALFDEMKQVAQDRGVSGFIDFLGFCNDMPAVFGAADVVVSASKEEGFGINLIEGMATGLPVVASSVRGHKEMVIQGGNGFFFHVDNTDEFCSAISNLYHDKSLYDAFSDCAWMCAKKFSVEHTLEQMSSIYDKYLVK